MPVCSYGECVGCTNTDDTCETRGGECPDTEKDGCCEDGSCAPECKKEEHNWYMYYNF